VEEQQQEQQLLPPVQRQQEQEAAPVNATGEAVDTGVKIEEDEDEEKEEEEEEPEMQILIDTTMPSSRSSSNETDVGGASRARARRQLEERVIGFQREVKALLARARELHALRTREIHEGCHTHADVILRRQGLPSARCAQLPREKRPLPGLYGSRLRHLKTINGHMFCPVYCLKYDKRGQYVVTGADDQLVKLWNVRTGCLMRSLRGHSGVITDLCVSSDNALLATSSEDGVVRIWNAADGTPLTLLQGHTDTINYVHFHPYYNLLLTGSDDGTARAWDLGKVKETTKEAVYPLLPLAPDALPPSCVFPHTPPVFPATAAAAVSGGGGGGEVEQRSKVKCISICPLGGFLATGAEDGVARIWSLADVEKRGGRAEEEAQLLLEASLGVDGEGGGGGGGGRAGVRRGATAMGPNASPSHQQQQRQQPLLGEGLGQLVCRLQASKTAVTDVNYSNLGDRLFTGSMPEGVVRVWSWGPNYSSLTHLVLDPQAVEGGGEGGGGEGEEEGGFGSAGGGGGGGAVGRSKTGVGERGKKELVPTVDNALWTCDDRQIITAHSTKPSSASSASSSAPAEPHPDWKQHLRVWDSSTGRLLRVLHGHRRQSTVLAVHPFDPRIVMSAGYDGKICLWDVSAVGKCMQSFTNILEWGPPGNDYNLGDAVALVDGQFSCDGWGFSVADACGRLLLFGPEEQGRYHRAPSEQYFVGDYDQLQWDVHGNVIDAARQVAPHLLPRRALTNSERVAYPEQPTWGLTGPLPVGKEEMKVSIVKARERTGGVEKLLEVRAAAAAKAAARMPSRTVLLGLGGGGGDRRGRGGRGGGSEGGRARYGEEFQYAWGSDGEDEDEVEVVGGRGDGMSRAERLRRRREGGGEGGREGVVSLRQRDRQRRREAALQRQQRRQRRRARGRGDDQDPSSDEDWTEEGRRVGEEEEEEEWEGGEGWSDEEEDDGNDSDYGGRVRRAGGAGRGRRQRVRAMALAGSTRDGGGGGGGGEERGAAGSGFGPIDPRAQGIPVELDEFIETITATTLLVAPTAAAAATGGEEEGEPATTDGERVGGGGGGGGGGGDEGGGGENGANAAAGMLPVLPPPPVVLTLEGAAPNAQGEVDRRTLLCSLCGKGHSQGQPLPGPVLGSHPLKMRDRPVWVHDDCAHWSPQTFVGQEDGRWYNIAVEVRRGRRTKCKGCGKLGATIGCNVRTCSKSYHYPCAVATGWSFTPEQYFHCQRHRPEGEGEGGAEAGGRRRGRVGRRRVGVMGAGAGAGGRGRRASRMAPARGRLRRRKRDGGVEGEEDDEEEEEEQEREEEEVEYLDVSATRGSSGSGIVYKGQWYPGEGMEMAREWLRASTQEQDVSGLLVPQQGDEVIYLPRAHYEAQVRVQWKEMEFTKAAGGGGGGGKKKAGATAAAVAGAGAGGGGGVVGGVGLSVLPAAGGGAPASLPASFTGPWDFLPIEWSAVKCRVDRVSYAFPETEEAYLAAPSIVCRVSLTVLAAGEFIEDTVDSEEEEEAMKEGGGGKQAYGWWNFDPVSAAWKGCTLDVDVRKDLSSDDAPAPTYFVVDACFNKAMLHGWEPRVRVKGPQVLYTRTGKRKFGFRYGSVVSLGKMMMKEDEEIQAAGSEEGAVQGPGPWKWLEIRWDEEGGGGVREAGSGEFVNAWEVLPAESGEEMPFWESPTLGKEEREVMLTGLTALASTDEFYNFVPPVPWDELPTYPLVVPLPMEYDLILERLRGGYYRSLSALETDVKLVLTNCQLFNQPGSEIIESAKRLQAAAMEVLKEGKKVAAVAAREKEKEKKQKKTTAGEEEEEGGEVGGLKGSGVLAAASASMGGVKVGQGMEEGGGGGGRGQEGGAFRRSGRERKRRQAFDGEEEEDEEEEEVQGHQRRLQDGGHHAAASVTAVTGSSERSRRERKRNRIYEDDGDEENGGIEHKHAVLGIIDGHRYRSVRLATSQAIAASLAETNGSHGNNNLAIINGSSNSNSRRSTRRGTRLASHSSPTFPPAAAALTQQQQRHQHQEPRQQLPVRRFRVVDSPVVGEGGRAGLRTYNMCIRLRRLSVEEEEKEEEEDEEEEEEEDSHDRKEADEENEEDEHDGNGGAGVAGESSKEGEDRESGNMGLGMRRMRLSVDQRSTAPGARGALVSGGTASSFFTSSPALTEGLSTERMQKVIRCFLDKLVLADHYQVLTDQGAWADIYRRGMTARFGSVDEVEGEVRVLVEGVARSSETIFMSEGRRMLNHLPTLIQEAVNES